MFHFYAEQGCAPNRYIHVIAETVVRAKAAFLEALHAKVLDVSGLSFDDLARQLLVRDLRKIADDLSIQNYLSTWSYDELAGSLQVGFEFGTEADMVLFKLRVG